MHLNSELIFKKYAAPFFKDGMKVLEIGPYGNPSAYQKIIGNPTIEWHTLNLENETLADMANKTSLTIIAGDPYAYPVEPGSYDIVLSGNVMEHVEDIYKWFRELIRITRPGGYIITVLPWSWPYHKAPVDCWRIYPDGFTAFTRTLGLENVTCTCESLELEHAFPGAAQYELPLVPGRSVFWDKSPQLVRTQIRWDRMVRHIPFLRRLLIPIEIAYDTLNISKKPL